MEASTAGRRSSPPPSSSAPAFDLDGTESCTGGGGRWSLKAWAGATSPAPAGGEPRAFWNPWLIVASLCFSTVIFVYGFYRPRLAVVYGFSYGPSTTSPQQQQQQQQERVANDAILYGPTDAPRDKYLGGLLASTGFNENSCLSRYQSTMYRKPSPHKPSAYLVQKLRQYEERHKRCGPYTAAYNRSLQFLQAGSAPEKEAECKYILWTPCNGLGNRILNLASNFLYALLTDRVLLIDPGKDITDLFCEPFPGTTWLLPKDFPISDFGPYDRWHPLSFGNLLKNGNITTEGNDLKPPPSFVYLHLAHDFQTEDMHFFCEPDQVALRKVPWVFLRTDNYIVPGYFLNQDFEPELSRLFPDKETVFHHLSRYLLHPTNEVWGMITRYYQSYLATARERLGIQIRIFNGKDAPFEVVSEQVINCTLKEKLLPEIDTNVSNAAMAADPENSKAVLLTSLYSGYFDKIKNIYWEHPAVGGVVVSVHQPSHEEWQQTDKASHDARAWAEMNLLSLADVLVTSAWSTFGYTGQGLGGIRPWILVRPEKAVMPQPTCVRDISMEPCFQTPPWYICREKKDGDNGKVVPFVTHCRDVSGGLKLVNRT